MYDIDPPSPVLRLVSSTTSTERLAYTVNRLHAEHQAQIAQADPIAVRHAAERPTAQSDQQHLAQRAFPPAPWYYAVFDHSYGGSGGYGAQGKPDLSDAQVAAVIGNWISATKASGRGALVFRSSGAIHRLRTLSEADADLSGALDAAL